MQAVTTPVEGDVDLNDVAGGDGYLFVRDGVGFAGRGVAARVPVDEVVAFLAAIEHDDRVGGTRGPIALGAVPFLPGSPADLIVPDLIVAKEDGLVHPSPLEHGLLVGLPELLDHLGRGVALLGEHDGGGA